MVECLPNIHDALHSTPSMAKQTNKQNNSNIKNRDHRYWFLLQHWLCSDVKEELSFSSFTKEPS